MEELEPEEAATPGKVIPVDDAEIPKKAKTKLKAQLGTTLKDMFDKQDLTTTDVEEAG